MGAPDLSKLTADQLEILESILEKRTSYERFCEDSELFPGEAPARPHRVICALAQMVADGEIPRLMLFAGPGTAKSTYISKRLVAWLVGYRPGIKIIGASHTKTLAEKHGRESRNIIDNDAYRMIFPEVRLAKDLQARADWATLDDSQYFGVGFDGGIAGRRCDCLVGSTMVQTPNGAAPISTIKPGDQVQTVYDGRVVYRRVVAVARRATREWYRIQTADGCVVEATGNHRFRVGRDWIEAARLAVGDVLVRVLPQPIGEDGGGVDEKGSPRRLQAGMQLELRDQAEQCCSRDEAGADLQRLRQGDVQSAKSRRSCLLESMLERGKKKGHGATEGSGEGLRNLRSAVSPSKQSVRLAHLFDGVQEQAAFDSDAQRAQPELAAWGRPESISGGEWAEVPSGAESGAGERRMALPDLPISARIAGTSSGSRQHEQRSGEHCDAVCDVPLRTAWSGATQTVGDAVSVVEKVGSDSGIEVFDIQVDGAECFFANGILVHNCLIIDDPFTGRKQADSETERENRWTVYQSDLRRRLRKDGGIILMHQRWHDDDIAGRILPADWDGRSGWVTSRTGEEWFVANLQMECEFPENDLLGRKAGELLWPEWFDAARIKQEKLEGVREWNAQFQGFPRDSEGGILKRSWWRKWPGQRPPVVDYVVQVYDTAFEEDEEDDYSARTTWGVFDIEHQDNAAVIAEAVARGTIKPWEWDGKRGEVHRYHAILLERMRERLDFPALRKAAKDAYRAYKPDRVLVEKKASGHSLLQELRRARIPVSAVKADRSKTSRAYASQPAFEQGAVWHMDRSWAQDVIDECAAFPTGKHDDVHDTVVHALMWLRRTYHISGRDENDPEDEDDSDRANGAPDEIPVRLDR